MLWWAREVRLNRSAATQVQLVSQHAYLCLIIVLHLQLVLLELVDLVTDQFHLLDLLCHRCFSLIRAATLSLKLGA